MGGSRRPSKGSWSNRLLDDFAFGDLPYTRFGAVLPYNGVSEPLPTTAFGTVT
jgi:hypothetical protein